MTNRVQFNARINLVVSIFCWSVMALILNDSEGLAVRASLMITTFGFGLVASVAFKNEITRRHVATRNFEIGCAAIAAGAVFVLLTSQLEVVTGLCAGFAGIALVTGYLASPRQQQA